VAAGAGVDVDVAAGAGPESVFLPESDFESDFDSDVEPDDPPSLFSPEPDLPASVPDFLA
jgi:hypothetical protein